MYLISINTQRKNKTLLTQGCLSIGLHLTNRQKEMSMKKYIAILNEKKKGTLNSDLLNQHVNHLRELTNQGKLFLCGPFNDNDGALQIIIAGSKDNAVRIIEQDPFIKECYYQSYDIYELIEANEANNWLCEDTQTKINLRTENT